MHMTNHGVGSNESLAPRCGQPGVKSSNGEPLTALVGGSMSLLPCAVAVEWSHYDLGGTRGTKHFCTCLQICKLTYHWCLLGLFCGECDALLLSECASTIKKSTKLGGRHAAKQLGTGPPHTRQ